MEYEYDDDSESLKPVTFDFNVYPEWGLREKSLREVVYIKRWQALMRQDMRSLYAQEAIANIYDVDVYWLENPLERKSKTKSFTLEDILGEDRLTADNATVATYFMLYWAKCGEQFLRGLRVQSRDNNLSVQDRRQRLMGAFEESNIAERMYNHGAIPDDQMNIDYIRSLTAEDSTEPRPFFYFREQFDEAVKRKEKNLRAGKQVTRRMLSWLASEEGLAFIDSCDRNIQIKIARERAERARNTMSGVHEWLSQRP